MAVVAESAHGTWTGQARVHLTKPHFQSNLYPWNWCNFYYCLYLADLQSSSLKLVQFSATIVCIMLLSGMCRLPCCGIFVVVVLGMSLGISLGIGGLGEAENTIFAASFSSKYQGEMIPVLLCVLLCVFYRTQVSLGSDLWVRVSLTEWGRFCKLNWCDSGWWIYKLNTNW